MPSSYTSSLRLTLPATGELSGSWGSTVNTGITELLDAAVAGTASISTWGGAGVAYTLSSTNGAADEARKMFIVASGSPGEAKNVICPAVSKFYVFRNDTTGGYALTLKTGSGTGISVPAGQYRFLYCDGTNVVEAFNSAGALTLSGAFTANGSVTLASNPTLSAGTANGVLYLNGSKVATSGSALTFNGTNAFVFGDGSSSTFTAARSSNGNTFTIRSGAGTDSALVLSGDTTTVTNFVALKAWNSSSYNEVGVYGNGASGYAYFNLSGSEQMRLTSTGLGIGTSSPSARLQTNATINTSYSATNTLAGGVIAYIKNASTTNSTDATIRLEATGSASVAVTSLSAVHTGDGASALTFGTRTNAASDVTEKLRLDSSGNLGLGVTPSAWATYKAFDIGRGALVNASTETDLVHNAYWNGTNWIYKANDYATHLLQINGQYRFFTAPSGTAGNTISFSQVMTLDASGNLSVGTTSSQGAKFAVNSGALPSGNAGLTFNAALSAGRLATGDTNNTTGVINQYLDTSITEISSGTSGAYAAGIVISGGTAAVNANTVRLFTAGTERARITSGGDLLVGTTSNPQNYRLNVATSAQTVLNLLAANNNNSDIFFSDTDADNRGVIRYNHSSDFMSLWTAGSERARITSGGDLLVGTTTSNGRLTVQGSDTGTTNAFYVSNSTPALAFRVQNDGYINTGTLGSSPYNNTTGSAANLFVDSGGGIARSTSSLKYKTDVKNAEHGLAEVMQLRPVTYKGKNDGNTVFGGLIAEEVHAAGLTEFVQYAPDGSPDALAYGNMVSLCIKAIQEQQALITDLRARVQALEAKP